jgi:hypothetical protein
MPSSGSRRLSSAATRKHRWWRSSTAAPNSGLRDHLDAEATALTRIGNSFHIRHSEHGQEELPGDPAVDYLFIRLAALIALLLRQTGRMQQG